MGGELIRGGGVELIRGGGRLIRVCVCVGGGGAIRSGLRSLV